MTETGSAVACGGWGHTKDRWRAALRVGVMACVAANGCGGRASIGTFACSESDADGSAGDAADDVACGPAPCSIIGGWQAGGGVVYCSAGASCTAIVPPCTSGAIRFDPSGELFRLTPAGWESACTFETCGDRISGPQLSNVLSVNYFEESSKSCGPWDLFVVAGGIGSDGGSTLPTCVLDAYAPCAGSYAAQGNGPLEFGPYSIELGYYRCAP
jgi:hypothetical protein